MLSAEGNQQQPVRRALAEAAELGADRVILTLGNPRTEDPDAILDDLLGGFRRPGKVRVEPDRKRAIEAALADARPGDAVLIAGKGRNAYQIFADRVIPFDDFAVTRAWLRGQQARQVPSRAIGRPEPISGYRQPLRPTSQAGGTLMFPSGNTEQPILIPSRAPEIPCYTWCKLLQVRFCGNFSKLGQKEVPGKPSLLQLSKSI